MTKTFSLLVEQCRRWQWKLLLGRFVIAFIAPDILLLFFFFLKEAEYVLEHLEMTSLLKIQNHVGLGLVVDPEEECPGGKGFDS